MANEIEIVVKDRDQSGPGMLAAQRKADDLKTKGVAAGKAIGAAMDGASRDARTLGEQGEAAGRKIVTWFELGAGAAAQLDRQIEQTWREAIRLRGEFEKTGGIDTFDKLIAKSKELDRQLAIKRRVFNPDEDDEERAIRFGARLADATARGLSRASGAISGVFANIFGVLPKEVQVLLGGAVIGAATAVAPLLGSSIAAAVVGAAGAGGVIGGLVVASKHSAVKAAATTVGDTFKDVLFDAGTQVVPATIVALDKVRRAIGEWRPMIRSVFANSAPLISPLVDAALEGTRRLLGGVEDAIARAGPVIDAIGTGLVRISDAASDMFSGMAENANANANALSDLFLVLDLGIRVTAAAVEGFSLLYRGLTFLNAAIMPTTENLTKLINGEMAAKEPTQSFKDELLGLKKSFNDNEEAAAAATREILGLNEAIAAGAEVDLAAREAKRRFEEAIDRANETIKRNGRTLDINSEKGRANQAAIDEIRRSALQAAAAVERQGGSQEEVNAILDRARNQYIKAAVAAGQNEREVRQLANQLFRLPKRTETDVRVFTSRALRDLSGFEKRVRSLDGRVITIRTRITSAGEHISGGIGSGTQVRNAHGGISGGLSDSAGRAQTGGPRGSWTWVGEMGPELVRLPHGSTVIPSGQSLMMANARPVDGGTVRTVQLLGMGDRLIQLFAKILGEALHSGQLRMTVDGRPVQVATL